MSAVQDDLEILKGSDDSVVTFVFKNEDHTLGNALRHLLMQNPNTDFCGYSVPHPSEPSMQLRLQTRNDANALEILRNGLTNLSGVCDSLQTKFDHALTGFDHGGQSNVSMSIDEPVTEPGEVKRSQKSHKK